MSAKCCRNFGHLHEGKNTFLHAGATGGADDDARALQLDRALDGAGDLLAGDGAHRSAHEREVHDREGDRETVHQAVAADDGVAKTGLLLVLGEALGVGAAGGEFEGVLGDQLTVGLLPGAVVDQEGDAALGRQAFVVAADREDVPIGLKVLGVDHLAIEGTLGPETCRDILLLRSRGVRALAEDGHGECPDIEAFSVKAKG